jgi:hypothetical protein
MTDLYGVVAVFDSPEAARTAASHLHRSGYRAFEAYTPYPVEGLDRILDPRPARLVPVLMFVGAVLGAVWGYWIQYWDEALNYPINVGGRPYNSWPAFIVGTFEFMLLVSVAAGFFGILAASRLPKLYHPIFEAAAFERASRDRFIICIEAADPMFEVASVRRAFEQLGAETVEEVRA